MSASKINRSTSPAWLIAIDPHGRQERSQAFSQMAWVNKRPTTSITAQVTP
jgi:hypothetical protein